MHVVYVCSLPDKIKALKRDLYLETIGIPPWTYYVYVRDFSLN